MQNRIGYHQALPLGFVVGAHIGYDLYSNPTVFFDSNRSSRDGSSDFIYMLLPTASLELRWYHAREKSQEEINRGGFVALGTAMQSHTGGIIFHKPLQGRWDYRWAVKAGWGYQAVLVLAVISYMLGYSQGKEYAELPWLLDVLLAIVWVAYGYVFFRTIGLRREQHIYVGLWFYGAFIISVAILHIFNNLALPVDWIYSYSLFSGTVDAMAQWWYGHNAVGFFLTAGFLYLYLTSLLVFAFRRLERRLNRHL